MLLGGRGGKVLLIFEKNSESSSDTSLSFFPGLMLWTDQALGEIFQDLVRNNLGIEDMQLLFLPFVILEFLFRDEVVSMSLQ